MYPHNHCGVHTLGKPLQCGTSRAHTHTVDSGWAAHYGSWLTRILFLSDSTRCRTWGNILARGFSDTLTLLLDCLLNIALLVCVACTCTWGVWCGYGYGGGNMWMCWHNLGLSLIHKQVTVSTSHSINKCKGEGNQICEYYGVGLIYVGDSNSAADCQWWNKLRGP